MIRILIFFLISLILANCSLNENSKIWNKKKKIKVEKNIEVIFEDKTISYKELNSNISLDFSQANVQNKIIDDKN